MEPRKGAQRRLAPLTQTASARHVLALAAAMLIVVSGCGGDDSDPETTASFSSQQSVEQGGSARAKSATPEDAKTPEAAGDGSAAQGTRGGGGGDQESSVSLPKGGRVPEATPAEEAQTTVADIALFSPAIRSGALPPAYTCDGKDSWPALSWQGVPPDTAELVLYAMSSQPVEGKLFVDWAVAGLDPSLTEIEAGRLPKGAVVGRNGFGQIGYSICPAQGEAETYVFALYALREPLSPSRGFDPVELRHKVLEVSGNVGLLAAGYGR